ncbi:MAG: bifunctional UDP-N-acetylglucosamine diphosphorylase/glucosamine-1-phosphate N-acetyltransferase GlmU [Vampirovibrio sp.]|nr:bifunctional UDP-N-acetylglucosamine diphosphorylase/glucosamine-1-phosphate N-acetyltransferase GlmU [Vampirovibrio sp.]
MTSSLNLIVMAAGKGTRLKSDLPKVLHPLFGKSLLWRSLASACELPVESAYVIVGHGRETVQAAMAKFSLPFNLTPIVQNPQLGTGHAVMQVQQAIGDKPLGTVVILSGDVPLLTPESLKSLVDLHHTQNHALTLLTTELNNPTGYGRVILAGETVQKIVEEKDASPEEKQVKTINTGIYCLDWQKVSPLLAKLNNNNAQGEFYLTDLVALSIAAKLSVGVACLEDSTESLGVNSRQDLAFCHQVLNNRSIDRLMSQGVTIVDPNQTTLGPEVLIGLDTVVHPGCVLTGNITIGKGCTIGPHSVLNDQVAIGDRTQILHSWIKNAVIGPDNIVGPFAQIRDGAELTHHVRVGNFVEVKNTRIDHHSNAAHLSYLGDAEVGSDVNYGAGAITANYDSIRDVKNKTVLEDGVKVSSNSVLVAPVIVGKDAFVAAGSVITNDVSPGDLAIARGRQADIAGWVTKAKEKAAEEKALETT